VTRGQLPQTAGSLGLNGGGAAAAVPPVHLVAVSESVDNTRYRSEICRPIRLAINTQKNEHTSNAMIRILQKASTGYFLQSVKSSSKQNQTINK